VTALLVARRELGAYLRAPVAYVVGVLFLAVQGASFAALVSTLADPARPAPLGAVLEGHFGGTLLHWTLQLAVVSLLAMRTIAEDRRTGVWEALLTAPVTEAEAVVGKWLGAVAFYGLLWLPTLAYLAVLAAFAPPGAAIDPGPVAAAYAGELVVGAAFLAVGVAWSAATASQIIAGVGTFATLLALVLAGEAPALGVDAGWLEALSPRAHLATFARGELALASLVPIAGLAAVGLSAAIALAGLGRRRRGESSARGIATGLVALIAVLATVVAMRHPRSWDVTARDLNSLDDATRAVLARVDAPVDVWIVQPSIADYQPVYEVTARALARMARAQPLLHVRARDPAAAEGGLEALARDAGLAVEDLSRVGGVVIAAGPRRRVVNLLDLAAFGRDALAAPTVTRLAAESAVASALAEVLERAPAVVCATTAHGELPLGGGADPTWAPVAARLARDGLRAEAIADVAGGVPARCRVVAVIAPKRPLSADESLAIDRYLDGGGGVLLAAPPVDPAGAGGATGLELVLARRGVVLSRAVAFDPDSAVDRSGAFRVVSGYGDDPIAAGFQGQRLTVWLAPRALDLRPSAGVAVAPLVSTSEGGWGEVDLVAPPARDERDLSGPVVIAAVARSRGGSLVVLGDALSASSVIAGRGHGAGDLLAATAIARLAGRTRPAVGGEDKTPEQVRLVMTAAERRAVAILCVGVIPLAYAVAGLIVVIVQRRRRGRAAEEAAS